MRFFLYKLIFPECHKLYWGRTCREFRYGRQNPVGGKFIGPHHNPDVQALLDSGFTAFFIQVAWCSSEIESKFLEERFLQRVWPTGGWTDRPSWLLNRTNKGVGFSTGESNPRFLPHNQEAARERAVKVLHTPEVKAKRNAGLQAWRKSPNYTHPSIGVKRPDLGEMNKTEPSRVKASQRVSARNKVLHTCPECGMEMNVGNLTKHLRAKHGRQSGLPTE